jgi:pimeloyl-ACP methyl ester carboxylesterase
VRRGNGAPVVLLHGIAASHHDWDDLLPVLEKNGRCAYALDLLGHGESAKPASPAYQMEWLYNHFLHWLKDYQKSFPQLQNLDWYSRQLKKRSFHQ